MIKKELINRIKKIKIIVLDVDGVMTDGKVIITDEGRELRNFNVKDGHGIKIAQRAGYQFAILSGKASKAVDVRAAGLGIKIIYQGQLRKVDPYQDIKKKHGYVDEEICCVGDDITELPLFRRCGFAVPVNDAVDELKGAAHFITEANGGHGAVRELCELILKTTGKWDEATARYYQD